MDRPLISIIIPIYNSEKYIKWCLDSIIGQTYQNIEIILVDDGSTDASGLICDEYAQKDLRICVLHQENCGQADARNKAFSVSTGEYIVYVDSDDYVGIDYVERLVETARKYGADIVQGRIIKFKDSNKVKSIKMGREALHIYSTTDALEEFCYQRIFDAGPCCKLIKRTIMEQLKFPVNMGYEDLAIIYKVYGAAKKLVYNPEIFYFYRQHVNSTMHKSFSEQKIDRIRIAESMQKYMEMHFSKNVQAVKSRYLLANIQLLMELPFDKRYKKILGEINNNIRKVRCGVAFDAKAKRGIRIMAIVSYLGVPILYCLGKCYKKIIH